MTNDSTPSRILVVDDDEKIRTYLANLLRKNDCEPVLAASANTALNILEHEHVDLTLSDIKMPEMNGLDLLQEIKAINPMMPVAIMTGMGTAENAIMALNRGAYNFITKPFRAQEILKVVRRGLDYREPFRRAAELLPFSHSRMQQVIPTRMELIRHVSSQLTEMANAVGYFPDTKRMEFRLVVDELVTNAMLHGNQRDPDKNVEIRLDINSERLMLEIIDEGDGFDISQIPDPRNIENLFKSSGRGILLCRLYMDELNYQGKGNHVVAIAYASTSGPSREQPQGKNSKA